MATHATKIATYLARTHDTLAELAAAGGGSRGVLVRLNPQLDGEVVAGDFVNVPRSMAAKRLHAKQALLHATAFGAQFGDPAWLNIAYRELGQAEIAGPAANARIIEYLHSVESLRPDMANSDETDWCSCFVNWCMESAGLTGTDKPNAQSWKNWGKPVIGAPSRGDVVVFQRWALGEQPSWKGHVGFWLSQTAGEIRLLGGNQGRAVSERSYPMNGQLGSSRYKLLAIRRP